MYFLIKLLISAIAVILTSYLLPGVNVKDFLTAVLVAALLAILNVIVKPILVFLTIPITVVTLGLFLLVINACLVLAADWVIADFSVDNFWWALLFSVILSIFTAAFNDIERLTTNSRRNR